VRGLNFIIAVIATLGLLPGTHAANRALGAEPDPRVLAEFDFDAGGQVLELPVVIGMDRYRFGLTTSKSGIFGRQFLNKLARLPAEIDEPDRPDRDDGNFSFRSAPEASMGGMKLRFPNNWVRCGRFGWYGGHFIPMDGLIGLEILAQYIMQIDFDNGKIRFLRSLPDDPGARFEITSLQRRPRLRMLTVKAQCGNEPPEEFNVNLEYPGEISLRPSFFRRLFETEQLCRRHREATFGTRLAPFDYVGIASSFNLGPFRSVSLRTGAWVDNEIGLEYLSRYTVTFDFPHGFMYLRPGKQFDRACGIDVSGLYAEWGPNGLEVSDCWPGTPAVAARLRSNDVILEVDGQPVSRETQSTFWRQMRKEGTTLQIVFKRGEQRLSTNIKLEALPGQIDDEKYRAFSRSYNVPEIRIQGEPSELPELEESVEPNERHDMGKNTAERDGDSSLVR